MSIRHVRCILEIAINFVSWGFIVVRYIFSMKTQITSDSVSYINFTRQKTVLSCCVCCTTYSSVDIILAPGWPNRSWSARAVARTRQLAGKSEQTHSRCSPLRGRRADPHPARRQHRQTGPLSICTTASYVASTYFVRCRKTFSSKYIFIGSVIWSMPFQY